MHHLNIVLILKFSVQNIIISSSSWDFPNSLSLSLPHSLSLSLPLLPSIPIIYLSWQVFAPLFCVKTDDPSILVCPCVEVHKRTSLTSSTFFYLTMPRVSWMVSEIRGRWPYSYFFFSFTQYYLTSSALNSWNIIDVNFFW